MEAETQPKLSICDTRRSKTDFLPVPLNPCTTEQKCGAPQLLTLVYHMQLLLLPPRELFLLELYNTVICPDSRGTPAFHPLAFSSCVPFKWSSTKSASNRALMSLSCIMQTVCCCTLTCMLPVQQPCLSKQTKDEDSFKLLMLSFKWGHRLPWSTAKPGLTGRQKRAEPP